MCFTLLSEKTSYSKYYQPINLLENNEINLGLGIFNCEFLKDTTTTYCPMQTLHFKLSPT